MTVTAGHDDDADNDTATVGHAVSGADYGANGVSANDVAVTVTDDETASTKVTLSVSPSLVGESAGQTTVTVTGMLDGAPRQVETALTVSVGAAADAAVAGTDYTAVADFPLTILAGRSSGTAIFSLTPTADDLDEADETLTVDGTVEGLTVEAAALTVEDDDERGVSVSPTALTVPEGGSASYTVALASRPTGPVTVTPSVASGTEVTVSGALTFTAADWATAQTVTVTAGHDDDADNDTATVGHAVSGADYDANGVSANDVAVTVTDDETASTKVTLSVSPSLVGEGDGATTVTVTGMLDGAPRQVETALTVSVGAGTDAAVAGTDYTAVADFPLTILAGRSSGTAIFSLTPTADDLDEADETLTVDGTVEGLAVEAAALTVEDDDERGVSVSPTALTVPEGRQCDLHGGAGVPADGAGDGDAVGGLRDRGDGERGADLHRGRLGYRADGDGDGRP